MPGEEGEANVSPEEQAEYTEFVTNGMEIIYPGDTKQVAPAILQSLNASGDPVQDLAMTTASVIAGLIESAGKAGHKPDPNIIYQGGVELLENLADIAEAAGIHDYQPKELESAMYNAADQIIRTNPGGIVDQAGAEQEFQQLVAADRNGGLEQAMPQIGQYNSQQERG